MYTEQLNLNEQATNLQLGIMEALTDPLLDRDMEHTIESIFDVTSENSLLLDHTFDIIPDISKQSPISLAQAHLLSEFEFTTTERSTMFIGKWFFIHKTQNQRKYCAMAMCAEGYVQCKNTHTKSDRCQ